MHRFLKDQLKTAQSSNYMASEEHQPITGVWVLSQSPQRGFRAAWLLVGGQGAMPPP